MPSLTPLASESGGESDLALICKDNSKTWAYSKRSGTTFGRSGTAHKTIARGGRWVV